jgi:A/G-specific adenine glycosylase
MLQLEKIQLPIAFLVLVAFLWSDLVLSVVASFHLSSTNLLLPFVKRTLCRSPRQSLHIVSRFRRHHNSNIMPVTTRSSRTPSSTTLLPATKATPTEKSESGSSSQDNLFFESWCKHDSTDFHAFSSTEEAAAIRAALLEWYRQHRRKLPWRGDPPPWQGSTVDFAQKKSAKRKQTHDFSGEVAFPVTAYGVWVSEIMLQQTRVEAVIPYWVRWMKAFPSVHHLAEATEEEINSHWAGLGFYRRARLLHTAAKQVVDSGMPTTVEGLLKLPGIGRYTASAVASIAYNISVPVVDGNVCRVLSRLRGIAQHVKAPALKDRHAWELAAAIVNDDAPGEVNQALMELGATYCAPAGTGVEEGDPLVDFYWSTKLSRQAADLYDSSSLEELLSLTKEAGNKKQGCQVCAQDGVSVALEQLIAHIDEGDGDDCSTYGHRVLPLAPPVVTKREEVFAVAAMSRQRDQSWLLVRRPKSGLLAGQWEFPSACVWTSAQQATKKRPLEVPFISSSARCEALDELLGELGKSIAVARRKNVRSEPIEHIFSHVRHTMWIEHGIIESFEDDEAWEWNGREVRWMTESDMQQVGITSGVKKILRTVRNPTGNESKPFSKARKKPK